MNFKKVLRIEYLVILALIVINMVMTINYRKLSTNNKDLQERFDSQQNNYANEIDFLNRYVQVTTIQTILSDNSKKDLATQFPGLIEKLNLGPKVVFYYPKNACSQCLNKIYQDLFILSEKIGPENILIFTDWEIRTELINPEKYKFSVFQISALNIEIDTMNQPYLFLLDYNLNLYSIFLPDIYDEFRNYYFTKTLPSYFENASKRVR